MKVAKKSIELINSTINNLSIKTKEDVVLQLKKVVPEFLSENSPFRTLDKS